MVQIITKENYNELVVNNPKPVLLDFWAVWCGPCRMMAPTVEEIAQDNPDIFVGKVNVDEEPELAQRFGITSIPTLVALKNGEVIGQTVGVQPKIKVLDLLY